MILVNVRNLMRVPHHPSFKEQMPGMLVQSNLVQQLMLDVGGPAFVGFCRPQLQY